MSRRIGYGRAAVLGAAVLSLVALSTPAWAGSGSTGQKTAFLYNSIPSPLKGNMASVGTEAYSTQELGDAITFAPGANRKLTAVTLTMSSWGCVSGSWVDKNCVTPLGATFTEPITFNVYDADGKDLLASATQTFTIPFRPSASTKCTGANAGKWWDSSLKSCFNGLATNVTFTFPSVSMPASVVFGVAYNTTHHGYQPIGEAASCFAAANCGYDSLNVALEGKVSVGSETTPGQLWANSSWAGFYCDGTTDNTFRLDSPGFGDCWAGYVPSVQFKGTS